MHDVASGGDQQLAVWPSATGNRLRWAMRFNRRLGVLLIDSPNAARLIDSLESRDRDLCDLRDNEFHCLVLSFFDIFFLAQNVPIDLEKWFLLFIPFGFINFFNGITQIGLIRRMNRKFKLSFSKKKFIAFCVAGHRQCSSLLVIVTWQSFYDGRYFVGFSSFDKLTVPSFKWHRWRWLPANEYPKSK